MYILRFLIIADYYLASGLMLVAGSIKLQQPGVGDILEYLFNAEILSLSATMFIARFLPWFEILLGGSALVGWRIEWQARVLAFIYTVYAGVIFYVSEGFLTLPLDCGCFGAGEGTPVYLLLLRNVLIAVPLFFISGRYMKFTLFHLVSPRKS